MFLVVWFDRDRCALPYCFLKMDDRTHDNFLEHADEIRGWFGALSIILPCPADLVERELREIVRTTIYGFRSGENLGIVKDYREAIANAWLPG